MGTFGHSLLTGGMQTSHAVAPGHFLVYDSMTDPNPVIAVETEYTASSAVRPTPSGVTAQLDFGGADGIDHLSRCHVDIERIHGPVREPV